MLLKSYQLRAIIFLIRIRNLNYEKTDANENGSKN